MMSSDQFPHPTDASDAGIRKFLDTAHLIDVVSWFDKLPSAQVRHHLAELGLPKRAMIFDNLPLEMQVEIAMALHLSDLTALVTAMHADDRADLFRLLSNNDQIRLIKELNPDVAADIRCLSAHSAECAGALMTSDYATLETDMTAANALAALRLQAPQTETIYRSYVIDDAQRLIGSVRLHTLILATDNTLIRDLMEPEPISVTLETDQEDVGKLIAHYNLLAIPVVDASGRLVGIVTHDDAADVMQAEATEDFQKMSTVVPFSQSIRKAGIGILYSKRIVWLALLVFGNLFSGAGIAYFEEMILAYVSLVFFLPLLIDSSGNAGSQSATLMVRALATGDVQLKDWGTLIIRELAVAAALGATMAAVVFPVGAWRGGTEVALTVGLTMFVVVLIGSLVGMSLPFLLNKLKLDPATASGPLVTTISDALGVLIYFSIARVVLSL
ncbi:magnesium transporter [Sulfitobacter sp. F26204]|uniref:magnesium transporter n=1 Tax=Sulfitobacter sp. F26204 TaxID=2996014 RepID=UPI00225E5C84|nr:magnesium transporter [Sulfitobacter sp. F26204]MCX7560568.1 magnesium transporter [Sulfitobacter sp. F26204]